MKQKKKKETTVGDAIYNFFRSIGAGERFRQNLAIAFWDAVVGDLIAKQTEPVEVRNGVLIVRVADPVWRQEMLFRKFEFIEKLNEKIGKKAIKDIKFY
jgi:predicted nucleic acid-binding Zn ribbon protein